MEFISRITQLNDLEFQADRCTIFHEMKTDTKLLGVLLTLVGIVAIPEGAFVFLGAIFLFIGIIILLAKVPKNILLARITMVLPILLAFSMSNLLQGNWVLFLTVTTKGVLCALTVTFLMATTSVENLLETLIRWHIPKVLVLQLSLLLRYLQTFVREVLSMHQSYNLRRGKTRGIDSRDVPAFMGSLIIRSLTKGEAVYDAISCRGGLMNREREKNDFATGSIEIRDLSLHYQDHYVIQGMNLSIADGEKVAIVGANGVGKTTLLHAMVGIGPSVEGELAVGGYPVSKNNWALIRSLCGLLFQNPDNQVFNARVYEDICFSAKKMGFSQSEMDQRAMRWLNRFQIPELKDRYCHTLSGGEKRMVALAGIMMVKPKILLMDEPSVFLDPRSRRRLIEELQMMSLTQVVVTHDLDLALEACNRVVILSEGKVSADGDAMAILKNETLLKQHGLELPLQLKIKTENG